MSDDDQRERDICTYGFCWCGEPRRGEIVDTDDGKLARLICYVGHTDE